ncbi:hypothetical protein D791_01040 [Nitrincola nitratireducens]|uniref:Uncharacterized protein n=1 Tax=Nitrincola nitratireducens TaxID=1229521 RepID=W9V5D9_9GAMM|nr:hypothetical protein D791_01040 [Nitrincola nitratireducens]
MRCFALIFNSAREMRETRKQSVQTMLTIIILKD